MQPAPNDIDDIDRKIAHAQREQRKVAQKKLRRDARAREGRCPYCGKLPAPGKTRCALCIALQTDRDRAATLHAQAERDRRRRESAPRRCGRCASDQVGPSGSRNGRKRYHCRACGYYSYNDLPATPPDYPCPYCRGRCVKSGRTKTERRAQVYLCTACRRTNINLCPADAPSPGGPFRHSLKIGLNYAAKIALMDYIQAKGMSQAQAVRDIFTRAATTPLGYVSRATSSRPLTQRYERFHTQDDWDDDSTIVSVPIPPPPPPVIPPGGVRLPDLRPDAARKLATQTGRARYCPTVLVVWEISVALNDAALAGLLATMQRRHLNHQDAARALCAEAKP